MIFHNIFFASFYYLQFVSFCFYSVVCVCVFRFFFITSQICFLTFSFPDSPVVVIRTSFFTEDEALLVNVSVTSVCIVICLDYIVFCFVCVCVCVCFNITALPFFLLNYSTKQNKENKLVCSRSELLYILCNAFD